MTMQIFYEIELHASTKNYILGHIFLLKMIDSSWSACFHIANDFLRQ